MANSKSVEDHLRLQINGRAFLEEPQHEGPSSLTNHSLVVAPKSLLHQPPAAVMSRYLFPSIQKMMSTSQESMHLAPPELMNFKKGSKITSNAIRNPSSQRKQNPYLRKTPNVMLYNAMS
jgi:hypothetical protein